MKIHEATWYSYETNVKALCGRKVKVCNCVDELDKVNKPTCNDCLQIRKQCDEDHHQDLVAQHQNHANPSYSFADR